MTSALPDVAVMDRLSTEIRADGEQPDKAHMRGGYMHAPIADTPQTQIGDLLRDNTNDLPLEVSREGLSHPEDRDELDAVRGMLFSCVIGAYLWLLIAMIAVRIL